MKTCFLSTLTITATMVMLATCQAIMAADSPGKPNIVIIFADDMGYGDIGVYGAKGYQTPHLDRLAGQGIRFTDFHVAESVCTASRVGLLTGSYPVRVGLTGAIGPGNPKGIHANEVLLPELLREAGYATGCFGKWHLGDQPSFLPLQNGFDEFFGLPYSNDMWPFHPTNRRFPPLPLLEGNQVIKKNLRWADQNQLTSQYTQKAVDFIRRHHEQRFFLYLAHSMPHVPLGASDKFRGKSKAGFFGDVIQEIDWSVGEVLKELKQQGVAKNTWVIFTSDNGPWLSYGDHAGSAGPLRAGKHTVFEGGFRVPCLMRWPGQIPAGAVNDVMISTMDILPTVASVVGRKLPTDRVIDGHDVLPVIQDKPTASSPWESYFYFKRDLHAVRSGDWKLIFPHASHHVLTAGKGGQPGSNGKLDLPLSLYNLATDPAESRNVVADHPDVVKRLQAQTTAFRKDLQNNSRQAGTVNNPQLLGGPALPNIVIFISDDLGRLETSIHGSKDVRTPTMDRLAANGMVFENAYVASPSCCPNRFSLLTGLMPARHGAHANHSKVKPGTSFLLPILKARGYHIVSFGKVAHGRNAMPGTDFKSLPPRNMSQNVRKYFNGKNIAGPVCLLVGDRRPHVPWSKESTYDPAKVTLPPDFIDTPETRRHWARYLGDITGMDEEMGRIYQFAQEKLGKNSIFLFTSDHGGQWPRGKWNLYDSGTRVPLVVSWPGKIAAGKRTEAMVSWVDILPTMLDLAGCDVPAQVDGKSFATVLTGKQQVHRDRIFTTQTGDGVMNIFPMRSVRIDNFKYIHNLRPDAYHTNHSDRLRKDGAGAYWDSWDQAAKTDPQAAAIIKRYYTRSKEELFDLTKDPLELNNLAKKPEYRKTLRQLKAELATWTKSQGDTLQPHRQPHLTSKPLPTGEQLLNQKPRKKKP